jgi:hypothetical protein
LIVLHAHMHLIGTGRYTLIALTNNYAVASNDPTLTADERTFLGWSDGGPSAPALRALFDDFVDSSEVGMRWVFPV